MILEVAASETGRAQTGVRALRGSDRGIDPKDLTDRGIGRVVEGESPVRRWSIGMAVSRVGRDTWNLAEYADHLKLQIT